MKGINLISTVVDVAGVCTEEDFQSFDFLHPTLKETPAAQVIQSLFNAKQDLEKKISLNDENKSLYEAIHARIMFRHTWLTLHLQGTKLTFDSYKDFKKLIKSAKYYLSLIKESSKKENVVGKYPPTCIEPNFAKILPGFSRQFKAIPFLSFLESIDFLENVLNEIFEVISLSDSYGLFDLMDWIIKWSWKSPNIISRSYFVVIIFLSSFFFLSSLFFLELPFL